MEMTKSEQIRIGLQKSFKNGKTARASIICYGYRTTPSGEFSVNPVEAQIVIFIFERFANGDSLGKISDTLARMGIDPPTGKETWSREAISNLLANEKYMGDVVLGKTHIVDGIQVKTHDANKQILMREHHSAIISYELSCIIQQEKRIRSRRRISVR